MITTTQLEQYAQQFKTNQTVIYREWLQVVMLKAIYDDPLGKGIFFKGGTAIHLIFGAPRFSEDLDFTVALNENEFEGCFKRTIERINAQEVLTIKKRVSIAGKRWLLTAHPSILSYPIYLTLDFSFRERVLHPQKSPFQTTFPIIFTSFVHHLSMEEILAEKVRAILTRRKGRDIYDFWYLISRGVTLKGEYVKKKLSYYHLTDITQAEVLSRITSFPKDEFVSDLRPFVPIPERTKLTDFYDYVQTQLKTALTP